MNWSLGEGGRKGSYWEEVGRFGFELDISIVLPRRAFQTTSAFASAKPTARHRGRNTPVAVLSACDASFKQILGAEILLSTVGQSVRNRDFSFDVGLKAVAEHVDLDHDLGVDIQGRAPLHPSSPVALLFTKNSS